MTYGYLRSVFIPVASSQSVRPILTGYWILDTGYWELHQSYTPVTNASPSTTSHRNAPAEVTT